MHVPLSLLRRLRDSLTGDFCESPRGGSVTTNSFAFLDTLPVDIAYAEVVARSTAIGFWLLLLL